MHRSVRCRFPSFDRHTPTMEKIIPFLFPLVFVAACRPPAHDDSNNHGHDPSTHADHPSALEPLAFTRYTDSVELYVQFEPLIVGRESRFTAHFTKLGALHIPVPSGKVDLVLKGLGTPQTTAADAPDGPGIFRMAITPKQEGSCRLFFTLRSGAITDTLTIDDLMVHASEQDALHEPRPAAPAGDITYLKEQAWRIPFALEQVRSAPFSRSVRVGAEVEPAIHSEEVVAARSAGTVHLSGEAPLEGMPVTKGRTLFTLSSQGVVGTNAGAAVAQARNDLDRAKADLERTEALHKDRLVTQDELLRARNAYANAEALVQQSASAQTVSAGINGYVRSLRVREGQFVQPGDILAILATNERIGIHADVPLRAFGQLETIADAHIRTAEGRTYTLSELNGRIVSVGKAADGSYVPVILEVDGAPGILPGGMVETWLLSPPRQHTLTVPLTAVLEQEGRSYCYVQTAGETMDKRTIVLGGNDGLRAEVIDGLRPGERVVSLGALDVKLASASGTMPAHGHEH